MTEEEKIENKNEEVPILSNLSQNDIDNDEQDEVDPEVFLENLKIKSDKYFDEHIVLTSKEELDNYLEACELLEIWSGEDEKEMVWKSLQKYAIAGKIYSDGALKGLKSLLDMEDENNDKGETVLMRVSRISINRNNNLAPNKLREKLLENLGDELSIDNAFQLKKIFKLLNLSNGITKVEYSDIEELCNKRKFIILSVDEIYNYLKNISKIGTNTDKLIEIDEEYLKQVEDIIEQKITGLTDNIQSDESEDDNMNNNEEENESIEEYEDEEILSPLEILQEIIKKHEENNASLSNLSEMKNNLKTINENICQSFNKLLHGEDEPLSTKEELQNEYKIKLNDIENYIENVKKENKETKTKIDKLKNSIINLNNKLENTEEDYRQLFEKYNNNQQYDVDDEIERLLDENMVLNREKEDKIAEIEKLYNDKMDKDREIHSLQLKIDEFIREKNEQISEINSLKLDNKKLKLDYDSMINNVIQKIEKQDRKEEEEQKKAEMKLKHKFKLTENELASKIEEIQKINDKNIPVEKKLLEKQKVLSDFDYDRLMSYSLKIENDYQKVFKESKDLDKKAKTAESKWKDLYEVIKKQKEQLGKLNGERTVLLAKVKSLKKETETNNAFRPSIAMNSAVRMSRISKLGATNQVHPVKKGMKVSNTNTCFGISGEENFEKKKKKTTKLKDKSINLEISAQMKKRNILNRTGFTEEIKEDINEEEDKKNTAQNDNEIIINKNEIDLNGEITFEGDEKKVIKNTININNKDGITVENISDINLMGNDIKEIKDDIGISYSNNRFLDSHENIKGHKSIKSFAKQMSKNQLNKYMENYIHQAIYNTNTDSSNKEVNNDDSQGNIINNEDNIINLENNNVSPFATNENIKNDETEVRGSVMIVHDNVNSANEMKGIVNDEEKLNNNLTNSLNNNEQYLNNLDSSQNLQNNIINNENNLQSNQQIIQNNLNDSENKDKINISLNDDSQNLQNIKDYKDSMQINLNQVDSSLQLSKNNINNSNILQSNLTNSENIINTNSNISIHKVNTLANPQTISKKIDMQKAFKKTKSLQVSSALSIAAKDEEQNNNNDYYSLYNESYVQGLLKDLKDNCKEKNLYSDVVYVLYKGKSLVKKIIMLTPSNIFTSEIKDLRPKVFGKKDELKKITISNKNINIVVFHFKKGDDLLIETLRRMDLLYYLKEHYHSSSKAIAFRFEDKFLLNYGTKSLSLSAMDKMFMTLSNFDGARKIGYLLKAQGIIFGKYFTEKFVVLSSIGLLVFDDPNTMPKRFYPIIGSKIIAVPEEKYGKSNCFEIHLQKGEVKIMAAHKKNELDSWLNEFKQIQNDFAERMRKIDTINKLEFQNNNSLPSLKEEILLEDEKDD